MNLFGYQHRVAQWIRTCFGSKIADHQMERNYRFLEEALELVQALGATRQDALDLVDYVFNRPTGEPKQEVGGVMVCLAALCAANSISLLDAAETELTRITDPVVMEKIRQKHLNKPIVGALPG